jgi:hypothetical protein
VHLTLKRSTGDSERTTGILQVGPAIFATIERPWIPHPDGPGGLLRKSCVPLGTYRVRPHHSVNFPNTYALVNHELGVYYQPGDIPAGQKWGRSAILMHIGNRVEHVVGCIAVGTEHGGLVMGRPTAVLRSTLAMRELDRILNRQSHTLEIV